MSNVPKPAKIVDTNISRIKMLDRQEVEDQLRTTQKLRIPPFLSKEAKREWRRLMFLYKQMKVDILDDLDRNALTVYCEAYSIYRTAQEEWKSLSTVSSYDENTQDRISTIFSVMEKQSNIMKKWSEQLCLTPVGRARMGVSKVNSKSRLEKFMDRNNEED